MQSQTCRKPALARRPLRPARRAWSEAYVRRPNFFTSDSIAPLRPRARTRCGRCRAAAAASNRPRARPRPRGDARGGGHTAREGKKQPTATHAQIHGLPPPIHDRTGPPRKKKQRDETTCVTAGDGWMVWSLESGRLGIGGGGSFSEGRAQAMYDSAFTACPVYSLCTTANFLFFFSSFLDSPCDCHWLAAAASCCRRACWGERLFMHAVTHSLHVECLYCLDRRPNGTARNAAPSPVIVTVVGVVGSPFELLRCKAGTVKLIRRHLTSNVSVLVLVKQVRVVPLSDIYKMG